MKCEKCQKNEATVLYREIINGKETRLSLCPACAGKLEEESGLSVKSLFSQSLFPEIFPLKRQAEEAKKCPLCGSDVSHIRRTGKVGCPECYNAFEDYLAPTLRRLHGGAVHCGRIPAKLKKIATEKNELKRLEEELKKSIECEDYENAAVLRDKIREMKSGGEL